ncbi:MAG: tRNA guanosine(34) transglycosylase Tgt [Myxococcota bacterium]|nr:tRNA guanosine(34) transglycosylase Tgt [Myxococcota bacterium]
MQCCTFQLKERAGEARRGVLKLPHGEVQTPAFMPVGTGGSVKGLTPEEVEEAGAEMLLANTYHLWVRPGHELIRELGGLHKVMKWNRPILTDSGGFQVFSFGDKARVKEEGVYFRSNIDGQWRMLTPELAVQIQEALGVDVAMALDECIEHDADRKRTLESTQRTTRWLERCLEAREQPDRTALFGIVQGGFHPDLREAHAQELSAMDLDGYAVGGLSVGETQHEMFSMLDLSVKHLPSHKARYLMGVGYPDDIVGAASRGIDMFDCVMPTRLARFGVLFTPFGRLALKHARFRDDPRPIDSDCACYTCRSFSRAYLRHLHMTKEVLAPRLLTIHNLTFYQLLMKRLRTAISDGPAAVQLLLDETRGWRNQYSDETEE